MQKMEARAWNYSYLSNSGYLKTFQVHDSGGCLSSLISLLLVKSSMKCWPSETKAGLSQQLDIIPKLLWLMKTLKSLERKSHLYKRWGAPKKGLGVSEHSCCCQICQIRDKSVSFASEILLNDLEVSSIWQVHAARFSCFFNAFS